MSPRQEFINQRMSELASMIAGSEDPIMDDQTFLSFLGYIRQIESLIKTARAKTHIPASPVGGD